MEKFVIEGGHPLSGVIRPNGSKNEALPAIAATLLTDQPVILKNLPHIRDVEAMVNVLAATGAETEWLDRNTLKVTAKTIDKGELDKELCRVIRASILFAGPMLARMGHLILPPPGGDVIGRRRLDTHFQGLQALGANLQIKQDYHFKTAGLQGTDFFLDEASVTGTENLVMAAVLAKGTTVLKNVACEPHVQGLCRMLNSMGAKITGIGTNLLNIEGVETLHGTEHIIGPDYLEIGSYIGLAAATHSALEIQGIRKSDLRMIRMVFEKLGIHLDIEENTLHVPWDQQMRIQSDYQNQIPKIDDGIWPAFPTDLMSILITVATQCKGTILFFEKMFDGRMFFVDNLIAMGAKIILCDPHRVVVVGPATLYGGRLESPDIRAGMALLIAALSARGVSTIYNIRQIDRGYERIDEKLRSIGAKIERVKA